MVSQRLVVLGLVMVLVVCLAEGRYLPTRAQDDRLLRLRQLLKDLLESDVEPEHTIPAYERRLYKREVLPYEHPLYHLQ